MKKPSYRRYKLGILFISIFVILKSVLCGKNCFNLLVLLMFLYYSFCFIKSSHTRIYCVCVATAPNLTGYYRSIAVSLLHYTKTLDIILTVHILLSNHHIPYFISYLTSYLLLLNILFLFYRIIILLLQLGYVLQIITFMSHLLLCFAEHRHLYFILLHGFIYYVTITSRETYYCSQLFYYSFFIHNELLYCCVFLDIRVVSILLIFYVF